MPRRRTALAIALTVPIALAVGVGTAWALDTRAARGEVMRNTTLAGTHVGGLARVQVRRIVAALDARVSGSTVTVETPGGRFRLAASEIGLRVDREATVEAALDVGRTAALPSRAAGWLRSLLSPRASPVVLDADRWLLRVLVAERDPTRTRQPVEPGITVDRGGRLAATRGRAGLGVDPDAVLDAVQAAATAGDLSLVVAVEPGPVPPRFTRTQAQRLAARAEALTAAPLEVEAGGVAASVAVDTLRGWLRAVPRPEGLVLSVDAGSATQDLADLLPDVGTAPVDARFEVRDGSVVIVPGRTGTACCAATAAPLLLDALVDRRSGPVPLPLRSVEPELTTDEARDLGVVELVSEFTTRYQAGQPRVRNIHRIADLVRGVVVQPGESFSVNGFVGRRTRDNGFVPAGVIYDGEFTEDVGGGISQFATTLFNAVFFAGLEFEEYQSHSIYLSRYPYGREATLSYPKPDLVFTNDSPHGVLIWTAYGDTTVTVSMWSTRRVTVQQTGQRAQPAGNCTRVVTERTIADLEDGRTEVDRVYALYRPAEGVRC